MAVQQRKRKKGTVYRAYWRNPITGGIEYGETRDNRRDAERDDEEVRIRRKYEPESFAPANCVFDPATPSFQDLARVYLTRTDITESTRKNDFYHLKAIIPHLGRIVAQEITHEDVKQLERTLRANGQKQNTVSRKVSIVRGVLSWATDEGYIKTNPIAGYRCKRGSDLRIPPPTPAEARLILQHAAPHLVRAIVIACNLGVRVGESELLKMTWDGLDLERGVFRIWAAQKNKDMPWRDITIKTSLLPMFAAWSAEDAITGIAHVIHFRGRPVSTIKTAWKAALRRAGITRRIRPYDMRHYFATEALAAGADIKSVAALMGHADPTMILRTYQHELERNKQAAVDAIPTVLGTENGHTSGHTNRHTNTHFSYSQEEKLQ